jgi:predicted nucleic acid-binding protein
MAETMTTYGLDACALIAYLRAEEGGNTLRTLLKEPDKRFVMHALNLGEVYYDTLRVAGQDKAHELFADIALLPIAVVWTVDVPLLESVGKYKTSYRISYADAFVLALAEQEKAIVISTDHHEFDPVEKAGEIRFFWLRK